MMSHRRTIQSDVATVCVAFCVAFFLATFCMSCASFPKKEAQTVLSAAQVACIIANAESDDPTIQSVCSFAQDLMPIVRKLVGEQRVASRRYADSVAGQCAKAR